MIKKAVLILLISVTATFTVKADGESREVLDRMTANMTEYANYRIDFTASAKGMVGNAKGMYLVSGDKYYISVQKQEQFSDGETRWEVNDADKEIIIDHIDLNTTNILNNPTRAFKFAPEEFNSTYQGVKEMRGMQSHHILLTPTGKMYGVGLVNIYISVAGDLPVALEYDYDGEKLTVSIDKFTGMMEADPKQFEFDESRYTGYEIIDFR